MSQPGRQRSIASYSQPAAAPTGWSVDGLAPGTDTTELTGFEVRQSAHAELVALTESLIAEYSGRIPAGTVIRCVAQAREQLLRAGVRAGLAAAVESMTHIRLRTIGPAHEAMT